MLMLFNGGTHGYSDYVNIKSFVHNTCNSHVKLKSTLDCDKFPGTIETNGKDSFKC